MLWTLALALVDPARGADAVSMSAMTTVTHGQQAPYIQFDAGEPGSLKAEMTCSGRSWNAGRRVGEGDSVRLELTGIAEGQHNCTGHLTFELDRGEIIDQDLTVTVSSMGMLTWEISYEKDFDRANKSFVAHASRPLTRAVASFVGAHGRQVDYAEGDLSDPMAPRFTWSTTDMIVKIEVEGIDGSNFKGMLEVFPYFYSIPHEDPVFATGSDAIAGSEVPKLEDTWSKIGEQFELYGSVLQMDLYVAGYTDTQGDAGSNLALSERRARSIAAWFVKRGFRGTVYYQGFGESALAVQTADNVDEAANRRVVYFLANQPPPPNPDIPRSNWRRL